MIESSLKTHSDEEVIEMMKYLAWMGRCSTFRDDFQAKVREWYKKNTEESEPYGIAISLDLWRIYEKKGMIETFQEYQQPESEISDEQKAFIYAINIGNDRK